MLNAFVVTVRPVRLLVEPLISSAFKRGTQKAVFLSPLHRHPTLGPFEHEDLRQVRRFDRLIRDSVPACLLVFDHRHDGAAIAIANLVVPKPLDF